MKKFLSVILALAMLVVPVGAMSCFADGGLGSGLLATMEKIGATKIQTVIILDKDGIYMTRYALFGKKDKFLRAQPCSAEAHMAIENVIDQTDVLQKINDLRCDKASLIFNGDINGFYFLQISFYNSKNELVKSEEYNNLDKYMFIFE